MSNHFSKPIKHKARKVTENPRRVPILLNVPILTVPLECGILFTLLFNLLLLGCAPFHYGQVSG